MATTVEIEGVGHTYARLYGVVDFTTLNADSDSTGAASGAAGSAQTSVVDVYITHTRFHIGRALDPEKGIVEGNTLVVNSHKVSRLHAVIELDEEEKRFMLTCLSKNGVDLNEKHLDVGVKVPLPSMARIRVGPLYAYFLLPKAEGQAAAATRVARTRPTVSYKTMLDTIYQKYFSKVGFFHLGDVASLAYKEFPEAGMTDNEENARRNFGVAAKKEGSGYVPVPVQEVPADLIDAPARARGKQWFKYVGAGAASGSAATSSGAATPLTSAPAVAGSTVASDDVEMEDAA